MEWRGDRRQRSDDHGRGKSLFPTGIDRRYLKASDHSTVCPWKGTARYFTVIVNGAVNPDAAWTYPDPKPEAERIRAHIAFWKGVEVG